MSLFALVAMRRLRSSFALVAIRRLRSSFALVAMRPLMSLFALVISGATKGLPFNGVAGTIGATKGVPFNGLASTSCAFAVGVRPSSVLVCTLASCRAGDISYRWAGAYQQ